MVMSCGDDDEPEPDTCMTDPTVTISQNLLGTWMIDGAADETVTFENNGTGSSSEEAFEFATSNDGKDYNNFGWEIESDTILKITYDYSPDTPVVPFIISENYTVLSNECDQIELESGFGSMTTLSR